MSFCFLHNVVSENYSVQNSPRGGGGGSIASSRSIKESIRSVFYDFITKYTNILLKK